MRLSSVAPRLLLEGDDEGNVVELEDDEFG